MSARSALVLLLIAASSSSLDIEIKVQNDPQCKFQGPQCSSDLRQIIYCSAKNGNSYVVTTCVGSSRCKMDSDGEYKCSSGSTDPPDTVRNDTVFTCTGIGGYPDGYRCGVGYLCSSPGAYPELVCECPFDGSAITFNPKFSCTTNKGVLESCGCPYRDRCKTSLMGGSFGENCHPGYYYICKGDGRGGFEPEVHKCPGDQIFVDGSCVPSPTAVSVEETSPSIQPVCKPYFPGCFQEEHVKCRAKGELIAHKVERCYYFCDGTLTLILRDCGKGSIFICKNGQCGCVFDLKH